MKTILIDCAVGLVALLASLRALSIIALFIIGPIMLLVDRRKARR